MCYSQVISLKVFAYICNYCKYFFFANIFVQLIFGTGFKKAYGFFGANSALVSAFICVRKLMRSGPRNSGKFAINSRGQILLRFADPCDFY